MSSSMPMEPPPPASEADYNSSPRRVNVAPLEPDRHIAFGVDDIPIPAHLEQAPPTPELNAAWAAVLAADHDPIPKRGYNTYFKYHYATADDIRAYVGYQLGKNGLHYEQHMAGFTVWGNLIRVTYYFVIRHVSGECSVPIRLDELARTTSEKGGPDDKALGKASVLALKNFTKSHFSIDTGDIADDPDGDGPVVVPDQAPVRPPARRQDSAPIAFRGTGLPPKTDRRPGEPSFIERAEHALDGEKNGSKWLKVLDTVLAHAQTLGDIGDIRTVASFRTAEETATPMIQQQIQDKVKKAIARITASDNGRGKDIAPEKLRAAAESGAFSDGQEVSTVTEALKADKTEDEGDSGFPGDRP